MDMILRIWQGALSRLRLVFHRARGLGAPSDVWLRAVEIPRQAWDIRLGHRVALDRGVTLLCTGPRTDTPRLRIGARTYINRGTMLDASASITVGEDVLIGPMSYITDHDHTSDGGLRSDPVEIGDRAWIGAHVSVLKGVRIGSDAVVGAGSVVTKSVPAGTVVAGNPAQVIRPSTP